MLVGLITLLLTGTNAKWCSVATKWCSVATIFQQVLTITSLHDDACSVAKLLEAH